MLSSFNTWLGFQQVRHLNNYAAIPGENTDRRAVEKGVRRANFGTHLHSVIPAQAGIQAFSMRFARRRRVLDSRLRGNDEEHFSTAPQAPFSVPS
jgi:hypothetical protein